MNDSTSRLNQNLAARKTQLALESVQQLKNSAEYMVIISDLDLIINELKRLFTPEEITAVYNEFLTTGYPFRFCHMLMIPYYITFSKNDELKDKIAPPSQWPAIMPIENILNAIQLSGPTPATPQFH